MGNDRFELVELGSGARLSRLIHGGWQLSEGHSDDRGDREALLRELEKLVAEGPATFDCADIYTGVEELLGELIRRCGPAARERVRIHTKFVPDLSVLPSIDKVYVERIIDRSLARLGVERLDLVQFHWWDFGIERYVETAGWLDELKRGGKIADLGVTNFDAKRLSELLDAGLEIVSNQVQYSLLDRRPAAALERLCLDRSVALFCYGVLAGGFLTEGFVHQPKPELGRLTNRSLVKYLLIIDEFGGWALFQELLEQMQEIAAKHAADLGREVPLSTVALRWVLDRPAVEAAIVGQRRASRSAQNRVALCFALDDEDQRLLERVLVRSTGPKGPVYELERDRDGRHGAIMKYDLNAHSTGKR